MSALPSLCRKRVAIACAMVVVLVGAGLWIWLLRPGAPGSVGLAQRSLPTPSAADGSIAGSRGGGPTAVAAPAVLRRAIRTAQTHRSSLSPVAYERALLGQELVRLEELARAGDGFSRAAAETVIELHKARFAARAVFLGESEEAAVAGPPDGPGAGIGLPPSALLDHTGWRALGDRDALHHPTFHQDCAVELERLNVPIEARNYLTRFLLESVDEIEALGAAALEVGAHLDEFPPEITSPTTPATDLPGIRAAWLHRQSTIRMLREMGVAVDGQFEHVLLNAGLGNTVLPYRWLDPH